MTVPGQETASYTKLEKIKTPKVPSHLDAAKENAKAAFDLDAKLHGKKHAKTLQSLRTSTSGIETQLSIMNKGVERWAILENQTDV